jgi:hypothetical protein
MLRKLSIVALFFGCLSLCAQTPGGQTNEVQTNNGSGGFGGSGLFTNTNHNYLGHFPLDSPPLGYCGGRQCAFVNIYGQDQAIEDSHGNLTGFGQSLYNYRRSLFTGLSIYNGPVSTGNETNGGSVIKMQEDNSVFHSTAISQDISGTVKCGKPADCAAAYLYIYNHGGYWYPADEGVTGIRVNGGNNFQFQGGATISGTPGIGATTLTASALSNPDDIFVGGFVINSSAGPTATCNATDYNSSTQLLTVSPAGCISKADATGTTQGAIVIPSSNVQGTALDITVHVDTGTGTTPAFKSGLIVFGCNNPEWEFVNATVTPDGSTDSNGNQVIQGVFYHGHASGCKVGQGGTWGIADFKADRLGANWKTSYFVFAAPDNSHLYVRTYVAGALGVINPWMHNYGTGQNSVTTAQITGDGTTISACNLGQSAYNFSGQFVRISGATPSGFNGTYTASTMTANSTGNLCITFPATQTGATGTATGATIQTGGDVNDPNDSTNLGTGGVYIWKAARLRQLGTTATTDANGISTINYNNQLVLYPNDMNFTSGQSLISMDDMQNKTEPLAGYGRYDTAPNGSLNNWVASRVAGYGVTGVNFRGFNVQNDNAFNMYKGGGGSGLLDGAAAMNVVGPWAWNFRGITPLPGGSGIEFLPNSMVAAGTGNNTYFPLRADGPGGNAGFYVSYNPNSGTSVIASGKGNGVATAITMTPDTVTVQAGTVKLPFAGSGTRPLTVDPSGTVAAPTGFTGTFTTTTGTCTVQNGLITGCS